MHKTGGVLVCLVAAAILLATAAVASARRLSASEWSILHAMNQARMSRGLRPLRLDFRLERTAQAHSEDMLDHQYFSHGAFATRVLQSGAAGPDYGENLAWGPDSALWVVSQWLASPGHRANLLRPGFRRVGVGTATGTFDGQAGALVVTADFAGH
jgi:uncharacterized protein YkwD